MNDLSMWLTISSLIFLGYYHFIDNDLGEALFISLLWPVILIFIISILFVAFLILTPVVIIVIFSILCSLAIIIPILFLVFCASILGIEKD